MPDERVARCLAASLLVALTACGDQATSPNFAPPRATAAVPPASRGPTAPATGTILRRLTFRVTDTVVTSTVTPEDGGWIQVESAGLMVYFPPGAVADNLEVSVTVHKGNRVVYSFEPHGTVFDRPIYIGQLLENTEVTGMGRRQPDLWAGYLEHGVTDVASDGSASFIETFDAWVFGAGGGANAWFATTHFSGYALASGRSDDGYGN
jgi:hypothetical protein